MDRMIRARAVLAELDALGLTVEDLIAAGGTTTRAGAPTVAEYVEVVAASYKPGTAATYRSAWRVLLVPDHERRRRLGTPTISDARRSAWS